ncbi:heterokaryon incompatibility protein [Paraphaeosphaeria sporulosa]
MFDFNADARQRKCMCRRVKRLLIKAAERKKRGDKETEDILITPSALENNLQHGPLVELLKCRCNICIPFTIRTPPEDNDVLAKKIATNAERRKLTAALAFIGGTFALRHLDEHRFDSIEVTLNNMRDRHDLIRELFGAIGKNRAFEDCKHTPRHTLSTNPFCLAEDFVEQLNNNATWLRIPSFQADNLFQRFSSRQNMPWIEETLLPIGNREAGRSFYKFKICDSFCDENLKQRPLFRKQIDLLDEESVRRATQEKDVLQVLKELAHHSIAEVLFAYQETVPPRLSLAFDFHPLDLDKILFPRAGGESILQEYDRPYRFPGSILDHWLWVGLLDIFDAVANVHEPLLPSLHTDAKSKWVGAHFDIKPGNIIITAEGRFLLTDFGLTYFKLLDVEREQETNFTTTPGTRMYAPPDGYSKLKAMQAEKNNNLVKQKWWNRDYDVWSLACVASELLAYLVRHPHDDSPVKFRKERDQEIGFGFWTKDRNDDEVTKQAVLRRLDSYLKSSDEYLQIVAQQLQKMFSMKRSAPMTVKACHSALSLGLKIDRRILQDRQDRSVAGPGTYSHLRDLRTSFSTERISSPLRCCLYLWENVSSGKLKLEIEFSGSDGETFIVQSCANVKTEDFLALSMFDPDQIYENNVLHTNSSFLDCSFRSMHDGFKFHFARRADYHHFFGAVTHQHIEIGSEFRFRRCKIKIKSRNYFSFKKEAREVLFKEKQDVHNGHLHILRELRDDAYQKVYIDEDTRSKTVKEPQRVNEISSRDSSDAMFGAQRRQQSKDPVRYRLALYLCDQVPALVLVSLNHENAFHINFNNMDRPYPRMELRNRSGMDIWGTVVRAPASVPGIPLNPKTITQDIEGSGRTSFELVEIEFYNMHDSSNFEKCYQKLKGADE